MIIVNAEVSEIVELGNSIFLIKVHAPKIARESTPGQFCNIKVSESNFPLLRRPFSICEVKGDFVSFMFNVLGEGTRNLAHKKVGDALDILGPLGNGFKFDDDYETAVFVAGGLGAAPFPFLTGKIPEGRKLLSFIGGRSEKDLITYGMKNTLLSTDDGTKGFKGNVVELLEAKKELLDESKIKVFACGPTPMLRAVKEFCLKYGYNCEVSTECAMACGFGICQGCPIQAEDKEGYYLVCKDGPVFNINKVVL
ncbi:MAG: dihydroorotate dehydrogenase electron transfer subunit [Ignavibacteria bacterium]|nr:dihydroorotate dehydrogenase electron transfer subunit [Ignavibacteria bacterium]MCU7504052.1 dihydroorotate dehydrogenase electron transfer subunit [Ignavibacteria bacterium]MCU7515424.1 dihydroorotate dehydrogenase electron transfer subunit [Ignavibacteria bacterium]